MMKMKIRRLSSLVWIYLLPVDRPEVLGAAQVHPPPPGLAKPLRELNHCKAKR